MEVFSREQLPVTHTPTVTSSFKKLDCLVCGLLMGDLVWTDTQAQHLVPPRRGAREQEEEEVRREEVTPRLEVRRAKEE